jgi:hypothetical protein
MWFDDGLDAESVRRALGHTDIKTTLGLYTHMMKGGQAKLAESMGRRMDESRASRKPGSWAGFEACTLPDRTVPKRAAERASRQESSEAPGSSEPRASPPPAAAATGV